MHEQQWEITIKGETSRSVFGVDMRDLTIKVARQCDILEAESRNDVDKKCVGVIFNTYGNSPDERKVNAVKYKKAIENAIEKILVREKFLLDDAKDIVVGDPCEIPRKSEKPLRGLSIKEENYQKEGVWALQGAARALIAQPKVLDRIRYENIMLGLRTELMAMWEWAHDVEKHMRRSPFYPHCIESTLSEPAGMGHKKGEELQRTHILYNTLRILQSSCMEANRIIVNLTVDEKLPQDLINNLTEIKQTIRDIKVKIPELKDLRLEDQS